jgi:hypothetical protein
LFSRSLEVRRRLRPTFPHAAGRHTQAVGAGGRRGEVDVAGTTGGDSVLGYAATSPA